MAVSVVLGVLLVVVGLPYVGVNSAGAAPGDTERVSVDSTGADANNRSFDPSVSETGSHVAFESLATDLVAGDTNNREDVFVRDRDTGLTERVSVDSTGSEADDSSHAPSISGDGRFVAYASWATNLVAGDTNDASDIFVHDQTTGVTERVSVDSAGVQANASSHDASISGDGRFVVFESYGSNLAAADTNNSGDIFVHDRDTGVTERVSVDSAGGQANGVTLNPSISGDGRFVAFQSDASNLVAADTNGQDDVFVHDRSTGVTQRVSVDSAGAQAVSRSRDASISEDGRFVAFWSLASNLVAGDTNASRDVFVHDRATGATERVSVDSVGNEAGSGLSWDPSISGDGGRVAFRSSATNLVASDTNGRDDVFVHDRASRLTERVSLDSAGGEANGGSFYPSISDDGTFVAFESGASNLVPGDTNSNHDVFIHELGTPTVPSQAVIEDLRGSNRRHSARAADPVSVVTGNFVTSFADLDFGARSRLSFGRTYNNQDPRVTSVGAGWSHTFGETAVERLDGAVEFIADDGRKTAAAAEGPGSWVRPEEIPGEIAERADGTFGIDWFDGGSSEFDASGRLEERAFWDGEVLTVTRNGAGELASVTSNRGPSLTFTHVNGKLSAVNASDGRTVSFGHNVDFLASATDEYGRTTTFEPDSQGRLKRQVDAAGVPVVTNVYDTFDRVVSQTTGTGEVITLTYDFANLETTVHDSVSDSTVVYHYDESGRTLRITDPFGNMIQRSEYDANGNPTALADRLSVTYAATFNDQDQPLSVTDPAIGTTTSTYDALHRLETVTVPNGTPTGETTTYTYDGAERLPSTVTDDLGNTTVYDVVDGLVASVTDPDGVTTSFTYTAARLLETATQTVGGVDLTTSYTYDSQGRPRFVTSPEGHTTESHYDGNGRVDYEIAADGGRTDYTYDTAGRVETITGPELSPTDTRRPVTTLSYDPLTGLLVEERRPGPGGTGVPEAVTSYAYNDAGDVEVVTHPDGTTTSSGYGPLGRLESRDDQLDRTTSFSYNADGDTATTTNQADEYTETTYDALGRVDLQYDAERRVTDTNYDPVGRVASVTAPGDATTTYAYDELSRVVSVIDPRLGETVTTYTPGGRVDTVTTPDGVVADHAYDTAGRLATVTRSGGRTTSYSYDKDSRVLAVTTPEGDVSSATYDPAGRVLASTDPAGVTTTRSWSYTGQLLSEQVEDQGAAGYVFDLAGNLESVTDPLGNATTYTYDEMGRRLTRTNAHGKTETWAYHDDGQLATYTDPLTDTFGARTTTYTYDPDTGRLTTIADPSERTTTISYNAAGQVVSETASMPDGLGGDIADQVTRVFDPATGRLTSMTDPTGTSTSTYSTAGDLTETIAADGRRIAYAYDTAGRRTSITHPDGTRLDYSYDPALGRLAAITPHWTLADTFTAADGRAASTAKWATNGSGAASIDANRLAIEPDTTALTLEPTVPATLDSDLTVTVDDPTGSTDVSTLRITLRSDATGDSRYRVDIPSDGTTIDLYRDDPAGDTLVASATRPPGDQPERLRIRAENDVVQVKVWDPAASSEPSTWAINETVTGVTTAAVPQITVIHGAGVPVTYLDDLTYLDLDAPPTAAVTYTWDLDDRMTAETLQDGSRSWAYSSGQLTNYVQDHPDPETPGQVAFAYSGTSAQTWTVPDRVTEITVDMAGGEGGIGGLTSGNGLGGRGGRIQSTLTVTPGETLLIGVGKVGTANNYGTGGAGGYDGGRKGGNGLIGGGGGGGQTFIKQGGTSPTNRVLVAGGGGGGQNNGARAQGGGTTLDTQSTSPVDATNGANGNILQNGGGGGGGGWRGGTGGPINGGTAAKGGTNMANTTVADDVTSTAGYQNGDGYVTISWVEPAPNDLDTTIAYDTAGRVDTEVTRWSAGTATYTEAHTYDYDPAGQLLSATSPTTTRTWTYDDLGRWETTSQPTGTFSYTYDDANQLATADCTAGPCADTTYTYDRAGRRTEATNNATTTTYGYGPDGKLDTHSIDDGTSTQTTNRTYDGAGNLTTVAVDDGTTTATATYTWDNTVPVSDLIEYDQGVNQIGIIGLTDAATTRTGGHTDLMATAATWQGDRTDLRGDPYGRPEISPESLGQLGYRGELHTGDLIHLRNRDYDPETGQFLTVDPLDGVDGTSVVATSYHYANNNPVNLTDPLGLQPGHGIFSPWAFLFSQIDTCGPGIGCLNEDEARGLTDLGRLVGGWVFQQTAGRVWRQLQEDLSAVGRGVATAYDWTADRVYDLSIVGIAIGKGLSDLFSSSGGHGTGQVMGPTPESPPTGTTTTTIPTGTTNCARSQNCDDGAELFHGTDEVAARAIVSGGFSTAAALEAGGDGRFYVTERLDHARLFAESNPRGGHPGIVRASLAISIERAVAGGLLKPEPLPGAYTVGNLAAFEAVVSYSLVPA